MQAYKPDLFKAEKSSSDGGVHSLSATCGIAGGHPSATNLFMCKRGSSIEKMMSEGTIPSDFSQADGTTEIYGAVTESHLDRNDIYRVISNGGGGYGDPLKRDIALIEEDCRCKRATKDIVREFYGCVIGDDGKADIDATELLRAKLRGQRLKKAKMPEHISGMAMKTKQPVFDQYNVTYPMIDVVSIGAGGGSIAWIQESTGLLKVGPKSAGALPGPACYCKGGTLPTVTDANMVLGRMNEKYFLGGKFTLDPQKAREAVRPLAEELGITIEEAALGIVEIADAHMGDLVRKMTVQRGYDPRTFTLYAFGGAGPLHVCGFTRGTGIEQVVIPGVSSVFSAFGIAQSDLNAVMEESFSAVMPVKPEIIRKRIDVLKSSAKTELMKGDVGNVTVTFAAEALMKYKGQKQELPVAVDFDVNSDEDVERLLCRFEEKYEQLYGEGTSFRQAGIQLMGFRVKATGSLSLPQLRLSAKNRPDKAIPEMQKVYMRETGGWTDVPFFKYSELPEGFTQSGPAIIISNHTTVYVAPDYTVRLDELDNLILTQK